MSELKNKKRMSNLNGTNVKPKSPDKREEYIKQQLNDGYLIQGIEAAAARHGDRLTRYESALRHKEGHRNLSCGESARLLLICNALDKVVNKENLLDMVWHGVNGQTMAEVKARLG